MYTNRLSNTGDAQTLSVRSAHAHNKQHPVGRYLSHTKLSSYITLTQLNKNTYHNTSKILSN